MANEIPSYESLGVTLREDLMDFIANISPTDTPLFAMTAKVPATNIVHEWLEDSLATVSTAGSLEGADFSAETIAQPTRHTNTTQIIRRDFAITGTNEAALHAGMTSQVGYQTRKKLQELARDTEATLIQSDQTATTTVGDADDTRLMRGLDSWAGNSTAAATAGLLAETEFNNLLEELWNDGVYADTVLLPASEKSSVSGYSTTLRIHHDGGPSDPRSIVRNVMAYESDFGTVDIFLERYCTSQGYAFKRDMVRCAVLRPTMVERLAKVGDSHRVMALHELTLEVMAPNAVGKWA